MMWSSLEDANSSTLFQASFRGSDWNARLPKKRESEPRSKAICPSSKDEPILGVIASYGCVRLISLKHILPIREVCFEEMAGLFFL